MTSRQPTPARSAPAFLARQFGGPSGLAGQGTGAAGEWQAAASPPLEEDDQEGYRAASPVSACRSTGDRVRYDMICHVLATSLYDDPAAGLCGDALAGLDEYPRARTVSADEAPGARVPAVIWRSVLRG